MNTQPAVVGAHPFLRLPADPLPDRFVDVARLGPEERRVIAEFHGPGCIRHIHLIGKRTPGLHRRIVIRIYWDDETEPSVEAPLGDLFGVCHGLTYYEINSRYISVQPQNSLNCYFAMPFARNARIEALTGPEEVGDLYCQIDWHRYRTPLEEPLRFHAKWRREFPTQAWGEDYMVLDALGHGRLLGFVYGMRLYDDRSRWSHGGADNIYIDGEGDAAFLRGVGGEDTFGTSFGGVLHTPESHLYAGMPYYVHEDVGGAKAVQRLAAYRFFEEDAIPFRQSLQFRFGSMANDICSTAYWYQDDPHTEFFRLPPWDKMQPGTELRRGEYDIPNDAGGEWWLCGPFENAAGEAMQDTLPAEKEFDPQATYDGEFAEESAWRKGFGAQGELRPHWLRRRANHNFIDFNHAFRPQSTGVAATPWPAAAIAAADLVADRAGEAVLHVAWDDELTLHVNDELIADRAHHVRFRTQQFNAKLTAGRNRVRLKLSNERGTTWGAWCFAFRAVLPGDRAIAPEAST